MSDHVIIPEEQIILYEDLELWMTRLPPALKSLPIINLAIPGSHDSMTYTIQRFNDVSPDESMFIQFLGNCFGPIAKPIIFNWSVTQYDTIVEQLSGGIRYFDLRLAKFQDNETCFVHGLFGAEITEPLQEIDHWLTLHPNEIVVLDFQHFYAFDDLHHRKVVEQIKQIFQKKICPAHTRLENISLYWLNSMRYQVLVVYRSIIARSETMLWPSGLWPTPWPDTVSTDQLIQFLNKTLEERSRSTGFVSQCLLTPDVAFVLRHFCGSLHSSLGIKCQNVALDWVQQKHPGPGGLNIVIADYISNHNFAFPKTVIQRNVSLLMRGQLYDNWYLKS